MIINYYQSEISAVKQFNKQKYLEINHKPPNKMSKNQLNHQLNKHKSSINPVKSRLFAMAGHTRWSGTSAMAAKPAQILRARIGFQEWLVTNQQ